MRGVTPIEERVSAPAPATPALSTEVELEPLAEPQSPPERKGPLGITFARWSLYLEFAGAVGTILLLTGMYRSRNLTQALAWSALISAVVAVITTSIALSRKEV